jgi:uncharacterized surface protein with fasciclin (FAS1) repeats
MSDVTSDFDDVVPDQNIVDIAAGSEDFELLVRALGDAGLVDTVRDLEGITVFAPSDAAFCQLAVDLGFAGDTTDEGAIYDFIAGALTDLGGGDLVSTLSDVLLFHVAPTDLSEADVAAAAEVNTLLDVALEPDGATLGDQEPDLPDPTIIAGDVSATNGTIHVIDRVLLPLDVPGNEAPEGPPNIVDIVVGSDDFDLLERALVTADLVGTIETSDDITVFAPNDAAFLSLAQALGFGGSGEDAAFGYLVDALQLLNGGSDPVELLESVLTYHVAPTALDSAAVTGADTITTLFGPLLTVDGTSLVDAEPDLPDQELVQLDIEASNGIVHVIDGVLLPLDVLQSAGPDDVRFEIGDASDESFVGGEDDDYFSGRAGDDTIEGGGGNDVGVGGAGTDTALFAGDLDDYAISITDDTIIFGDKGGAGTGEDSIAGVERAEFGDGASFGADGAIDLTQLASAAQVSAEELTALAEFYVFFFDRAPDSFGLAYWANALATGTGLEEIAERFFESDEGESTLPPAADLPALVDQGYANLFEREADESGRAFWLGKLEDGEITRAEFVLRFIESADTADAETLADKAAIGLGYGAVTGLNDVDDADAVMDIYDPEDRLDSLDEAEQEIFQLANDANFDETEVTLQIVGVTDNPFVGLA